MVNSIEGRGEVLEDASSMATLDGSSSLKIQGQNCTRTTMIFANPKLKIGIW